MLAACRHGRGREGGAVGELVEEPVKEFASIGSSIARSIPRVRLVPPSCARRAVSVVDAHYLQHHRLLGKCHQRVGSRRHSGRNPAPCSLVQLGKALPHLLEVFDPLPLRPIQLSPVPFLCGSNRPGALS